MQHAAVQRTSSAADVFPFGFQLIPAFKPEELHENIRSSFGRGLLPVQLCQPHDGVLSIIGGGPSLSETWGEIEGYAAAVNGSLGFLLKKGIVPQMCGVCDPSPHIADIVNADPRVTYFLASIVHPKVYDKLLNAGCRVFRWNISSVPGGEEVQEELEPGALVVGGGSTMGLRWLTLGYTMGFREFHLHGMDSSFRLEADRGRASHAYPDHQDDKDWIEYDGFDTRPNFLGQVSDFVSWLERLTQADVEPITIKVHGDGLLQTTFAKWKELNPGLHEGKPKPEFLTRDFIWPENDALGMPAITADAENIPRFMAHLDQRRVCVQAGGNVGVYPAHLSRYFLEVHTFEPDAENYRCLSHNITLNRGKIVASHAALGDVSGICRTEGHKAHNSGAIHIKAGEGDVPVVRIDDLHLQFCDLIWLDIEGYEAKALEGASETVDRCRPAVIIEENSLAKIHGLEAGAARAWLRARGYRPKAKHGNDTLFMPGPVIARPSRERTESITVATVQVGNYLGRGKEYLEKLYAGVRGNLPGPWKGVCLTDDPSTLPEGVEAREVPAGLVGWWNKIALFKPGMFEPGERVLFVDLDAIITGDLSDLASYSGKFGILRDFFYPDHYGSAVMMWEAGVADHIWTRWDENGRQSFDAWGDQRFIEAMMPNADMLQDKFPRQVVSFKAHCRPFGKIPEDARILMFHGQPRPHEATEPWVKALWDGA